MSNLYLRYFDNETLVNSLEEALLFIDSIPEIELTKDIVEDLKAYYSSDQFFPKRYKVRPRVYFIVIKTEAATMQDFKEKKALRKDISTDSASPEQQLNNIREGWYEGTIDFKRVVVNHLGKCEYRDTTFTAQCKASSGAQCYSKIVEHLLMRVDKRSQFPSAKGKSFKFNYLGTCK